MYEDLHLAVIPDGNRRYADEHGLSNYDGHMAGADRAVDLLDWVEEYPSITEVTAWALSRTNYRKREENELEGLNSVYELYADILNDDESPIHEHGISIGTIGDLSVLSPTAQDSIERLVDETSIYDDKHLNLAFFYDADYERDQALESARKDGPVLRQLARRILGINEPTSEDLRPYYELPKVDLLMRYGDDSAHLSGFTTMHQLENATIVFPEKNWPEAEQADIERALEKHDRKKSGGA